MSSSDSDAVFDDDHGDESVAASGIGAPEFDASAPLVLRPIGRVRSPLTARLEAPRQPAASTVEGAIELYPASGIEHALSDLDSFRFIWVLFWFHHNRGFRSKVLPPRSSQRRGIFATRSPYRPNPIGLSAVELLKIEGRVLHVRNLDILDGTPVLDLKPYLPYTDSIPEAKNGWLESARAAADPLPAYEVSFESTAREQLDFLAARGVVLEPYVREVLRLGPQPHPYRRIKVTSEGSLLAYKEWRFLFRAEGPRIIVLRVKSGYRPSELFTNPDPELELHREFVARPTLKSG